MPTTPAAAPTIADAMDDVEGLVYQIKVMLSALSEEELLDAFGDLDDLRVDIDARLTAIAEQEAAEAMA